MPLRASHLFYTEYTVKAHARQGRAQVHMRTAEIAPPSAKNS